MRFEWDPRKRASNRRKHGIDFARIPEMFEGVVATVIDERNDHEERFLSVGLLGLSVIVVAHTEHDGTIRIISARKAT
jgi:uncharacterized DUF497 family protein